jgi:hypothetical protein
MSETMRQDMRFSFVLIGIRLRGSFARRGDWDAIFPKKNCEKGRRQEILEAVRLRSEWRPQRNQEELLNANYHKHPCAPSFHARRPGPDIRMRSASFGAIELAAAASRTTPHGRPSHSSSISDLRAATGKSRGSQTRHSGTSCSARKWAIAIGHRRALHRLALLANFFVENGSSALFEKSVSRLPETSSANRDGRVSNLRMMESKSIRALDLRPYSPVLHPGFVQT